MKTRVSRGLLHVLMYMTCRFGVCCREEIGSQPGRFVRRKRVSGARFLGATRKFRYRLGRSGGLLHDRGSLQVGGRPGSVNVKLTLRRPLRAPVL